MRTANKNVKFQKINNNRAKTLERTANKNVK